MKPIPASLVITHDARSGGSVLHRICVLDEVTPVFL